MNTTTTSTVGMIGEILGGAMFVIVPALLIAQFYFPALRFGGL